MLTWTTRETHTATLNGLHYRVFDNPFTTPGGRYIALVAFTDGAGRLFESIVGAFPTVAAAKAACELDAKRT